MDLLAAVARGVLELLGAIGVHGALRPVAVLGDELAGLTEERLVLGAVRIDPIERAVGVDDLHETVRTSGHHGARFGIDDLLAGPARGLEV